MNFSIQLCLYRTFRIIDDNKSGTLDQKEFEKCVRDFGLTQFTKEHTDQLFQEFDKDKSGTIDYEEFLVKMRVRYTHWKVAGVIVTGELKNSKPFWRLLN